MERLFDHDDVFSGFTLSTPKGTIYAAVIVGNYSAPQAVVQMNAQSPVYSMNYSVDGRPVGDEVITHPVIETRQGKQKMTRIKKKFGKKGENILGLTVPFTYTYHINSGSKEIGKRYPEKSVDVHELYHKIVQDSLPGIENYGDLEELTVRDTTDKLLGTDSAKDYVSFIVRKHAPMYGIDMAREIATKTKVKANELSDIIIREPVKIYLPTNAEEEKMQEKGELPPYINTAA
jgi:hypothetical protein